MAGTIGELTSLGPLPRFTVSQFPPVAVGARTVDGICPAQVFRILKNCGSVGPPPCTAKNVRPVCGIKMVCCTAEMVMVTAKVTVCTGLVLVLVSVSEPL